MENLFDFLLTYIRIDVIMSIVNNIHSQITEVSSMKNINEAWKIVSRLEAMTKGGTKKVKWTDIYSSEDELINDLKKVEIPASGQPPFAGMTPMFRGYQYIFSFAKRLQDGRELTPKQMAQAKRIALEIKKASSIV